MDTRRDFLKKAVLLSGAAGFSGMVPASIQRALAIDPIKGSTYLDAAHVVILMQENRSFDHCFGTLQGVRGFNDPRAVCLPDRKPVWLQTDRKGDTYSPFRLNIMDTRSTWTGDLPHTRASQVDAYNNGKHDQWLTAKRSGNPKYADLPLTLGYYNRQDLPFNYAMADAFTICDQHFCSAMTSTTPNRSFFWSGKIRSEENGLPKANIRNDDFDYGKMTWKSFPELLHEHDVPWKFYQNEISFNGGMSEEEMAWLSNFGCNPLEFFEAFKVRSTGSKTLSAKEQQLYDSAFVVNAGDPAYRSLSSQTYHDGRQPREITVPKGDVLHQFREDVNTGKLPTVSWLAGAQNFSDHPSAPWYGAWYVSEVMDILTKNPEVWKKTIFIVTYDENDGYFDHVVPFSINDNKIPGTGKCSAGIDTEIEHVRLEHELKQGIAPHQAREAPVGLGFRVPLIIASPWTRGGKVCSQVFDHTSTLQFLESFLNQKLHKQIRQENISQWRRTICGDLSSVFSAYNTSTIQTMPFLHRDRHVENINNAQFKDAPSGFKKITEDHIARIMHESAHNNPLAEQETGIRPSCALPYELYADGKWNANSNSFELLMRSGQEIFGQRSAGSPFTVYAPGPYTDAPGVEQLARKWSFAVSAGDALSYQWPIQAFGNQRYHLKVYGPNGFYREFAGDTQDPSIAVAMTYEKQRLSGKPTGNLVVSFINSGQQPHSVHITDNAYRAPEVSRQVPAAATTSMIIPLQKSFGWYDLTFRVHGADRFENICAGRVETGRESFSDPLMGRFTL